MQCQVCGYVMDPFDTECPRCLRNAQRPVTPNRQQYYASSPQRTTAMAGQVDIENVHQLIVKRVANQVRTVGAILTVLGILGALVIILIGIGLRSLSSGMATLVIIAGITAGLGSFIFLVIGSWAEQMLLVLGRIDARLTEREQPVDITIE